MPIPDGVTVACSRRAAGMGRHGVRRTGNRRGAAAPSTHCWRLARVYTGAGGLAGVAGQRGRLRGIDRADARPGNRPAAVLRRAAPRRDRRPGPGRRAAVGPQGPDHRAGRQRRSLPRDPRARRAARAPRPVDRRRTPRLARRRHQPGTAAQPPRRPPVGRRRPRHPAGHRRRSPPRPRLQAATYCATPSAPGSSAAATTSSWSPSSWDTSGPRPPAATPCPPPTTPRPPSTASPQPADQRFSLPIAGFRRTPAGPGAVAP